MIDSGCVGGSPRPRADDWGPGSWPTADVPCAHKEYIKYKGNTGNTGIS